MNAYTQHRKRGEVVWSEPATIEDDDLIKAARDRAAFMVRSGYDGCEAGRVHEWRLVRNGVTVLAWEEDGR